MSQVNGRRTSLDTDDGAGPPRRDGPSVVVVIVVTAHTPPGAPLAALLNALPTDAASAVLKMVPPHEAVAAVQRVLAAATPLEPLERRRPPGAAPDEGGPTARLTAREREVLRLIAAGRTNREIAAAVQLSVGTIKGHVQQLLTKLGVADRTQAAVRGLQLGLLPTG